MRRRRKGQDEPIRADAIAEALVQQFGSAPVDMIDTIKTRLAGVLGERLENDVRVRSLLNGELVLEVAYTRFASDLKYRGDELIKSLSTSPLEGVIRKVKVVVLRTEEP